MRNVLIITFVIIYISTQFVLASTLDYDNSTSVLSDLPAETEFEIQTNSEYASLSDLDDDDAGIISAITDMILGLFIPSEGFYEEKLNELDLKLRSKLPFQAYIDTIGRLKDVSESLNGDASALNITYSYYGETYTFEMGSYLEPYLPRIRGIITALYVFFICYYNYRQILFLVRGSDMPRTHVDR